MGGSHMDETALMSKSEAIDERLYWDTSLKMRVMVCWIWTDIGIGAWFPNLIKDCIY